MSFQLYAHRRAMVRRSALEGVSSAVASITIVTPGNRPPGREPGLYIELAYADGAQQLLCVPPDQLDELAASTKALMAVRGAV